MSLRVSALDPSILFEIVVHAGRTLATFFNGLPGRGGQTGNFECRFFLTSRFCWSFQWVWRPELQCSCGARGIAVMDISVNTFRSMKLQCRRSGTVNGGRVVSLVSHFVFRFLLRLILYGNYVGIGKVEVLLLFCVIVVYDTDVWIIYFHIWFHC